MSLSNSRDWNLKLPIQQNVYNYFYIRKHLYKRTFTIEKTYIIVCMSENLRKIGVKVTVNRQLWIPVLLFSRSLKIGVNFAFVLTPKSAVKSSWWTRRTFSTSTISLIYHTHPSPHTCYLPFPQLHMSSDLYDFKKVIESRYRK